MISFEMEISFYLNHFHLFEWLKYDVMLHCYKFIYSCPQLSGKSFEPLLCPSAFICISITKGQHHMTMDNMLQKRFHNGYFHVLTLMSFKNVAYDFFSYVVNNNKLIFYRIPLDKQKSDQVLCFVALKSKLSPLDEPYQVWRQRRFGARTTTLETENNW